MTDDEIIANGLTVIRDGVLKGDWQYVCDGYNIILEEGLEPPAPKLSKIEKIKQNMAKKKDKKAEIGTQEEPVEAADPNINSLGSAKDELGDALKIVVESTGAKDGDGNEIKFITVPEDLKQKRKNEKVKVEQEKRPKGETKLTKMTGFNPDNKIPSWIPKA